MVDHSAIQEHFERGFLARSLGVQAQGLETYYLYDRIRTMIPDHQPVLEAGCGSGKWVAWAAGQGWEAIGVDWSPKLVKHASQEVPGARFIACDMRDMPLADVSVGSIISLGAIEHAIEGPEAALQEYARVLRPGGVALITVPFLGPVRRVVWTARRPVKGSPTVRRLLGKPGGRVRLDRTGTRPGWTADFLPTEEGWAFYQYQLTKPKMRGLLAEVGFTIEEEFVFGPEEGLVQTLRSLAGRYDLETGGVSLNPAGRLLRRLLPAGTYEHMLGYMIHKPRTTDSAGLNDWVDTHRAGPARD